MLRIAVVCLFSAVSLVLSGAKADRHELTPKIRQQIRAAEILVESTGSDRSEWKKAAAENAEYFLRIEIGAV